MDKRFPKFSVRSSSVRDFRLIIEPLESRQLLASNIWSGTSIKLPDWADVSDSQSLWVDSREFWIRQRADRWVFSNADSVRLAHWGLAPVKPITTDKSVFEFVNPSSKSLKASFFQSSDFASATPVLQFLGSDSEAVLFDEVIVSLTKASEIKNLVGRHPNIRDYVPVAGTSDQFVLSLGNSRGFNTLRAAQIFEDDIAVQWVSPNFYQTREKFYTPNDPRLGNQWGFNNTGQGGGTIDADSDLVEAWDVSPGGSSAITIGIVDDGVSLDHPDLDPWVNQNELVGNGIDDDGNGWVDDIHGWNFIGNNNLSQHGSAVDWHGTAVAGVATARGDNALGVVGAAYRSRPLSARIFEGGMVASDANIASALYYAAGRTANGLGTWKSADVVNISWGGGIPSMVINTALQWSVTAGRQGKGATVLMAVGNNAGTISEPAAQSKNISGGISVGATNYLGTKSDYSNIGPALDVVAPSDDSRSGFWSIDSTDRLGALGFGPEDYTGIGEHGFGGTSAATALASGSVALLLARANTIGLELTPAQIKSLVQSNTDLIDGINFPYVPSQGRNDSHGFGRLNAQKLLTSLGVAEIGILSSVGELQNNQSNFQIGSVFVGDSIDVPFRIRNQGTLPLSISNISVTGSDFIRLAGPAIDSLAVGEFSYFVIRYSPTFSGNASSTIQIASNDLDEPLFSFSLSATAIAPSIGGSIFEDWNGNGTKDRLDQTTLPAQIVYLDANSNGVFDANLSSNMFSNLSATSIPDQSTIFIPIQVTGVAEYVTDLNVTLNILHTMVSDLTVKLQAPSGRQVQLLSGAGQNSDRFSNLTLDDEALLSTSQGTSPLTGSYRPDMPLWNLDGELPNGIWNLVVTDEHPLDTGTVLNWTLSLTTGEQSTRSQSNGYFHFQGLGIGSYVIRPIVPDGFMISGVSSRSVILGSANASVVNQHFGLGKANRFYAVAYDDFNMDGLLQPSDAPLANRTIYLDENSNGLLDPPTQTQFSSGSLNLIVPDLSTRSHSISVSGLFGRLNDVDVSLNIAMTFDADLNVFLIHPDGTRIELFTGVGGSRDNFTNTILDDQSSVSINQGTAPFTGRFRPEGRLADLNGKSANGIWTIEISDIGFGDQATLLNWTLHTSSEEASTITTFFGTQYLDLPVGNRDVRLHPAFGWVYTQPSDGKRSVSVSGLPLYDQRFGITATPILSSNSSSVQGLEGTTITNAGTWSDADAFGNEVSLSASVGTVVKNLNGTWNWSITVDDQQSSTPVVITATDAFGNSTQLSFTYEVANAPPTLTRALSQVQGEVLSTILNSGTVMDVPSDTISLSASSGTIVNNHNGTWTWSITPSNRIQQQVVTITANDEDGGTSTVQFLLDATVAIRSRRTYYRGSAFESVLGVDAAIDSSKTLLPSSNLSAATSSTNVINYSRGINGVLLEIAGLVSNALTQSDFAFRVAPNGVSGTVVPSNWSAAPNPQSIHVIEGTATSPARVFVDWPDNAIQNTWLQVIVLANARTGLLERETFYLGHAFADVNLAAPYQVTNIDLVSVQSSISNSLVSVSEVRDINKDRRVTAADLSIVQSRISASVLLDNIVVPPKGSEAEGDGFETTDSQDLIFVCTSFDPIDTVLPLSIDENIGIESETISRTSRIGPLPGPSSKATFQRNDYFDDGTLRYNNEGLAYYFDESERELQTSKPTDGKSDDGPIKNDQPANLDVPAYHSRPSATKKIYLDFDGQSVSGTPWNNQDFTGSYNTGSVINANPFSMDADLTTFSSTELNAIFDVWARISEDFAPFQVDVTTEFPGAAAFTAGGQAIRVLFSTNRDATTGALWYPFSGGVAFIGSWFWTVGAPVWVFTNNLSGSSKNFAEAASHEVGHSFGLSHDGRLSPSEEYYSGHGSGPTGWAPIMGTGYSRSLTQWSLGEYTNANNPEDDLSVISNTIGYVPDDHGNSISTATQMIVGNGGAVASSGLITTRTDVDYFRFATQSGTISLLANPVDPSTDRGNLDVQFVLLNSAGTVMTSSNDLDLLSGSITANLPKGIYSIFVDGVGRISTAGHPGYSDYGSIGRYTISGTVIPNASPNANSDSSNTPVNQSVLIDVLANDSDPENDALTFASLGSPSSGTVTVESGKVRYNPASGFSGIVTFNYTIADELGANATGIVTVNVSNNSPPSLTIDQSSVSGNEGTAITNSGTWADSDIPVNNVSLSASIGTISKNANGTWNWQITAPDQIPSTQVQITANDGAGGITSLSFTYTAINVAPTLTVSQNNVSGNVLTNLQNNGSWNDVASDTVSMSASLGTVSVLSNGTWTWSYASPLRLAGQTITITASDEDGGTTQKSFSVDALVAVTDRRVWYRNSEFETILGVSGALDSTKLLLSPTSNPTTTSFSNVTSYVRGINGIVLDIAGLTNTALSESDFVFRIAPQGVSGTVTPADWPVAPSPSSIQVTPGTSITPARVAVAWPDNAIQNTWLQVIVKANANTGLIDRQVFYLGHSLGEVDGESPYRITTLDVALVRSEVSNNLISVSDARDIDKDRRITTLDVGLIRSIVSNTIVLNQISVPAAGSGGEGEQRNSIGARSAASGPPNNPIGSNDSACYVDLDSVFSDWYMESHHPRPGKRR